MSKAAVPIPPPLVPQQARGRATHRRILDGAAEVLVDSGYEGFTTSAVSERAEVSIGALFRHFPTRETLVVATVEHLFVRLRERFAEATREIEPEDPCERIRGYLQALWAQLGHPDYLACLDVYGVARTHPKLAAALGPMAQEQSAVTDAAAIEFYSSMGIPLEAGLPGLGAAIFYAVEGLARDEAIVGGEGDGLQEEMFHHLERLILRLVPLKPDEKTT